MSINIIPGSVFTNTLNVTGDTTVGSGMVVGGNVTVCGELVTNSISVYQTFTISLGSTSGTIDTNGNGVTFDINVCGDTVTPLIKNYWGDYVSTFDGLSGNIAFTSLGNTIDITSNGNAINIESTPTGLPPGTNYGNYIYWNGNAYVVGNSNIVIGASAGLTNQAPNAIAIGIQAGQLNQSSETIAFGNNAGSNTQSPYSIAMGYFSGRNTQSSNAIAIGRTAATNNQGSASIAIGFAAGSNTQASNAIAIGLSAGQVTQKTGAIAFGNGAGFTNQGANAIAIGSLAGLSNQASNSIVLNALGTTLNAPNNGFFVAPIRNLLNTNSLVYNPSTYEVTYTNALNTAGWANFPAISNIDVQNNRFISSTGEVTISGKTVIQGASISDTVGPYLVFSNDGVIDTSVYTSSGYNFAKLQIWGGGGRSLGTNTGGAGAYLETFIDLTTSPILSISVGGVGQPPNPATLDYGSGGVYGGGRGGNGGSGLSPGSGGAGGGGATLVRSNATIVSIAGGGGGAGNSTSFAYGGNAQQDGYSFFGGSGKGAVSNSVGAGGTATGYTSGQIGTIIGGIPPTAFGSGGPGASNITLPLPGGGGGGGGWAGGGGGTAQAGGGGGSSYLVGTGNIFPSSSVFGQASHISSRIQAGSANMSGGVIATFYSSDINVVAPVLRVTGGPIMAPEFRSFATSTALLASNTTSNVFDFLGEPGVYDCVSYSCDGFGYLTSSKIGVNYIGQAFVMMSANYPTDDHGLDVSITNPLTYTITNNTSNVGRDLTNIVTKYTKVG